MYYKRNVSNTFSTGFIFPHQVNKEKKMNKTIPEKYHATGLTSRVISFYLQNRCCAISNPYVSLRMALSETKVFWGISTDAGFSRESPNLSGQFGMMGEGTGVKFPSGMIYEFIFHHKLLQIRIPPLFCLFTSSIPVLRTG